MKLKTNLILALLVMLLQSACAIYTNADRKRDEQILNESRSAPLKHIEVQREKDDVSRIKNSKLGLGFHIIEENCSKIISGDLILWPSCEHKTFVNLELTCVTGKVGDDMEISVPLKYVNVEVDILDKEIKGQNPRFPIKLQPTPQGQVSFSFEGTAMINSEFVLRRNGYEKRFFLGSAQVPIVLESKFCFQ